MQIELDSSLFIYLQFWNGKKTPMKQFIFDQIKTEK